jgi:hypothetical protein
VNALDAITPLALDGPSHVALYGPLALWTAALLAAIVFATRRKRVLRLGGLITSGLLVALAGLHWQAIHLERAKAQALWGAYLQSGAQGTAVVQPNTVPTDGGQRPLVLLNSHLLEGLHESIQKASDGDLFGQVIDTQPRVADGVWNEPITTDVYGAPLPPNATVVALLNPRNDPQGAPDTPPSANVVRIFIGATNAEGAFDPGATRPWQDHHAVFQTPTFPWPLSITTPWEPVSAAQVVDAVVEVLLADGPA